MKRQEYGQKPKQQKSSKISQAISLLQRKHYGCLSKIFCCKCFYCCQNFDFTLLTSKNRKGAFQQMVKKYLKTMHNNSSQNKANIVMDPFFILVALLLGQQSQIYNELLQQVSNTNQTIIFSKQDLQFYIPQLCTYLVFHEQMGNAEVTTLLQRACKIDLHFSLRYYFFMKSLQIIDSTYQIKKLPIVQKYNIAFRNKINLCHKVKFLTKEAKAKRKGSLQKKIDALSDQDNKQNQYDKTQQHLRGSTKSDIHSYSHQGSEEIKQKKDKKYEIEANKHLKPFKPQRKYSLSSSSTDLDQQFIIQNQKNLKICKYYNQNGNKQEQQIGFRQKAITYLYIDQVYQSFISTSNKSKNMKQNYPQGLFQSTAQFFLDLVSLSQQLLKQQQNRNQKFQKYLAEINTKLPAAIYIPLTKSQYHGLNILNIIIKQSRIFKTKQRVPYKICFQTFYNPNINEQSHRQKKIKSTLNSNKNLKRSMLFQQDIFLDIDGQNIQPPLSNKDRTSLQILQQKVGKAQDNHNNRSNPLNQKERQKDLRLSSQSTSGISQLNNKISIDFKSLKKNIWSKLFQIKKFINQNDQPNNKGKFKQNKNSSKLNKTQNETIQKQSDVQKGQKYEQQHNNIEYISNFSQKYSKKEQQQKKSQFYIEENLISSNKQTEVQQVSQYQQNQRYLFGQPQKERLQSSIIKSPYSKLPGYKIINLIIKSNDDLRQQAFAMQLLQQFQRIFQMEKLKIKLCPYEVMPLSHNSGMIQFISEAITIDELIKKQGNLRFVRKDKIKLKNFIRSLAGYSLVTYMLQVKDRHNQNIMIKKNGCVVHIDYGFFLSSMPGKGVQLEKNIPFKLTYQYIDALGGLKSKQFGEFRKLFYQGFNALRKHQHRILILTKLMYSSYGTTMRCFEKGDQSIQKFVSRFNPKNVRTDGQLSLFCQELINLSIENWRAKWYDRWQYFAQGILY